MDVRITNDYRDVMDFKFHSEWVGAIIYCYSPNFKSETTNPSDFNEEAYVFVCLRLRRRFLHIVNARDILYGLWEDYDFDCWISEDEKLGTARKFLCDNPIQLAERIRQLYDDFTEH